jgi:hypothetical protein
MQHAENIAPFSVVSFWRKPEKEWARMARPGDAIPSGKDT